MKLYVMLAFRRVAPAPNEVLVELFETLARRGHTLEIGIAAGTNKHAGTLMRIRHSDRLADATAASGDERYLSV